MQPRILRIVGPLMCVLAAVVPIAWELATPSSLPTLYLHQRITGRLDPRCTFGAVRLSAARERARLVEADQRARRSRVIKTEGDLALMGNSRRYVLDS